MKTIAVTGHRPQHLGWSFDLTAEPWQWLTGQFAELFTLAGAERVISGLALGVDTAAAVATLGLDGVHLHAAIPFEGQDSRWPKESRDTYARIRAAADSEKVVCEGGYAPWKMQRRNEYMVDNADVVIAVWNGKPGGTANCVEYARKVGKPIIYIDPEKREVRGEETLSIESVVDEEVPLRPQDD